MIDKPLLRTLHVRIAALSVFALSPSASAAPSPALPPPMSLNAGWQLQDAARVPEEGPAVSQAAYKPAGWRRATVPGTVLTSLVNDGVYPEPLYGENDRPDKIPESLCRTAYWYRTRFVVPRVYAGRRVLLHFDGINYAAEVWVNGTRVGTIRGAFARGVFDITAEAHRAGQNVLAVRILPPPDPGTPIEQTQARGVGPNGGVLAKDGPTFLCTIGWDWIPGIRDRDMGLWQGVWLSAAGPVELRDPVVDSDLPLPRTDTADLTVQATLTNATAKPQTGVLAGTADGGISFKTPVTLAAGETRVVTVTPAAVPALHVHHPRLWWPNGYGPQNLYTMRLSFAQNGVVSDAGRVSFGIRKIAYAVPGSDNLTLSVNGVPVVAKGGDWGMDEAMKRIPRSRLEAQIRLHKLANYTIIRNWVGQSTSEDFYDMCDRYGILVWDEFFQPNPYDGPNPDDDALYLANVREKILRFRSHPCIALWCARNEGNPPPEIDKGIQALTAELDPGRLYQRSSTEGRGVRSSGPYYWRAPREFYNVDAPFKTEIGSVSIPTLEAVHAMMPRKDWGTVNDDWAEHDLAAGAQHGDSYPTVLGERYGRETSLADFVRKGQMANYEAFRAMYEGRFAVLFHPVTGVITWMSDPAQPSFVWQIYSYDLEPNASLFAVRKACEPVHVMMNQEDGHLMVVNSTPRPLTGMIARVAVYDMDGRLRYEHADPVAVDPDSTGDFGEIAFPAGLSPVHFVKLELRDGHKKLVSDNFYWRADPAHPDDFTALSAMPAVALDVTAARRPDPQKCLLTVMLRNPTRSVALMAHLQLRRAKSGLRVLPVYCSDNYISLLPGESRTVTVEAAASDLGGEAPLLAVDGWNVTVKPVARGPVRVAANAEAFVKPAPALPVDAVGGPVRIDCGGGGDAPFVFGTSPSDGFTGDRDERGGSTKTVGDAIDTRTAHAAPMMVYQSERWGPSVYTIPAERGKTYTVRLHFAETTFDRAGARRFNVAIDGKRVLTDFDVFAEAGGKFRAVVKEFPGVVPNADGKIAIDFSVGSADQPKIDGIEVLPEP